MTPRRKSERGFTVGEILIVITALGVISIISLPIFTGLVEGAQQRTEEYNIACIKTGIELKSYKDFTDTL